MADKIKDNKVVDNKTTDAVTPNSKEVTASQAQKGKPVSKSTKKQGKGRRRPSKASKSSKNSRKGYEHTRQDGNKERIGTNLYDNDVAWYTQTLTLLDPVTKVPMVPIHGQSIRLKVQDFDWDNVSADTYDGKITIPGIARIDFHPLIPTISGTEGIQMGNDMFNTVGKAIFAQLRRVINGPRFYNTTDLMAYILTVSSISGMMERVRRAYNSTFHSNLYSRYTREVLVDSIGRTGDYDYLVVNGPRFVSRFNALALKLRNLLIPVTIPVAQRWKWLNSFLFADAAVVKPQMYVPVQNGFYSLNYQGNTATTPYKLDYKDLGSSSIDDILTELELTIDALISNDIIGYINADLLRAYGSENLVHVPMIMNSQEFKYDPVFSEEFLDQVHHLTITNLTPAQYEARLNQVTKEFSLPLVFKDNEPKLSLLENGLIDTNSEVLTSPEVTIKTRMMALAKPYDDGDDLTGLEITCGSELYSKLTIINSAPQQGPQFHIESSILTFLGLPTSTESDLRQIRVVGALTNFNKAPLLYDHNVQEGAHNSDAIYAYGSINNYGVIDSATLAYINQAVIASMVGLSDKTAVQVALIGKKTI